MLPAIKPIPMELKRAVTRPHRDFNKLNICKPIQCDTPFDDTCFACAASFGCSFNLNADSFSLHPMIVAEMDGEGVYKTIGTTKYYRYDLWYQDIDDDDDDEYKFAVMEITPLSFDECKKEFYHTDYGYLCAKPISPSLNHVLFIKSAFLNGVETYDSQLDTTEFYPDSFVFDFLRIRCIKFNGYTIYPLASRNAAAASEPYEMQHYIDDIIDAVNDIHHKLLPLNNPTTKSFYEYYQDKLITDASGYIHLIFDVSSFIYIIFILKYKLLHESKCNEATIGEMNTKRTRISSGCVLYKGLDTKQQQAMINSVHTLLGKYWFEKVSKPSKKFPYTFKYSSHLHPIHSIYNHMFIVSRNYYKSTQQPVSCTVIQHLKVADEIISYYENMRPMSSAFGSWIGNMRSTDILDEGWFDNILNRYFNGTEIIVFSVLFIISCCNYTNNINYANYTNMDYVGYNISNNGYYLLGYNTLNVYNVYNDDWYNRAEFNVSNITDYVWYIDDNGDSKSIYID